MSAVPHTEAPIYVEYTQIGDQYNFNGANDTAMERRPVARNECWLDLLTVPNVAPAPAPWPGGAVLGLTRGISGVPLGPVPGNAFRFAYQFSTPAPAPPYDHFMNMVPAVYSGGIFTPTLRDAFGRVVPYNPSVWVADGLLQLVEFKYRTPQALGFAPPFTIDYWQYVGPVAGSGTLANDGAGARVYEVGTADPSLLRTIAPDAANLGASVTETASEILIGNTMTGVNLEPAGPGVGQVFQQKDPATGDLDFRVVEPDPAAANLGIAISQTGTAVVVGNTMTGTNLEPAAPGVGQVFAQKNTGTGALEFRTIDLDATPANFGLALTQTSTALTVGNTMTGVNLEPADPLTALVFAQKNTVTGDLEFRALEAGLNVSLSASATGIMISATPGGGGGITGLANSGTGADVYATLVATTAVLRRLNATANGMTITQNVADITFDNTLTGANVGTGVQLFRDKTTNFLNLRSIIADPNSGVILTQNADDITVSIDPRAVILIDNEGTGTGLIFDAVVSNVAYMRTLQVDPTVGNGGIAIATVGLVVNIGNTMTGANVGAGAGTVFSAKTTAGLLQLNTFAGTANGLTVSAPAANVITIDNTLTGSNVGAGSGTVFSAKSGASLQFNTFAGTANGLTVSAPAANVITIDNTLTGVNVGAGSQFFSAKSGASLNFRSLIAAVGSGLTLTQNANDVTISATAGSVVTMANEGAGAGLIFDAVVANVANLRTLQVDPTVGNGGIAIATAGTVVNIGNTMTGANVGAGAGTVFSAKTTAGILQLNTFAGTANGLTVSAPAANVITIDNTLTGSNVGIGAGTVFSAKSGASLQFNTFAGTANGLTVSAPAANVITIDNTLTGANVGAGSQLFSAKSGASLNFRSLIAAAGSGLMLTQNTNDVTISASAGTVITIANEGAGAGLIFDAVVANVANLRTLQVDPTVGNGGIAIATAGTVVNIGNTMTGANVGVGTGTVFSAKTTAGILQLNTFAGTANGLTVSAPVANVITIDNTLTGSNVGVGAGTVFSAKSGASLQFNTFAGTANGLTVSAPAANVITIDNTLTGANVGAGAGLFRDKTTSFINLRSLIAAAGSGLTLTQNANDVTISASVGSVVTMANEGAGAGLIFDAVVANVANLRTLQVDPTVGNEGIAIATVGLVVNIGNTMTGANVGVGTGTVFSAKTAAGILQLNTFAGTTNGLTVSAPAANVITIDNTLTGSNVGAGSGTVFSAKSGASLQFNTFAGTANGLTVSAPVANVITIDNTLTGANLGAGSQLFSAKSGASLNFRSLIAAAGSGLTLTQNTNDVTISASAGTVITMANEGAGIGQIFDSVVANVANLRTLRIDPTVGNEGIEMATVGTVVNIGTSITGSNVGGGSGIIFNSKAGSLLQLNSFNGTLNGLTVSAPVAGLITIDNTLTGANVGAGSQVFSAKSGASLNFRSLLAAASSGISLTQNTNDITFGLPNHNTWVIRDQKTTGTNGGNFAAASWVQRDLNTIQSFGPTTGNVILGTNEISFVTIGTYLIFAVSSCINPVATNRVGFNQLRIQNTSAATTVAYGTSDCLPDVDNSAGHPTAMAVVTTTVVSTKVQIQHFKTTAGTTTNGLGLATGIAGNNECYTIVLVSQIN